MIKVKDGYAKLIGTTYQGSATQVLLSNGGDLEYSASSKASTLVQRNASQHIYATYFNSAISDEALTDIGSVYVRNTSDTFIRRVSKTQFYSILDDKFVTLDTTQSITGAKTFSTSVRFANNASIIQNQNDTSNYTTILKWYKNGASRNTYDPSIGQHNTGGDGNGSICILPYPTETSPWGGTVGLFISKGVLKLDGKSVALAENYYTKTESDERYVNVTGDTMTGPLIVKAAITGTQLISTIATGTSPLKVTSTTVVTNLNSDLLDGLHETSFFRARGDQSIASSVPTTTELATSNNLCGSWNVKYTGASGHLVQFNAGSGSTRYMQFYSTYFGSLYWRNSTDSTLNTKSWKTIVDSANYTGIVLKIGTATKGSATLPIYLNAGTPTACSTTLGVSITGNAATATKLQTARTINGTSFDGTTNIVTAYWGTARTISLSGAVTGSASVNGSQNVTITTTYQFGSIDGRYVTLTTAQTVSGVKTFSTQQKFTVATGTSPFTVTSTTVVTNLNSDLLDGRHLGNATGRIPYIVSFPAYSSFGSSTSTLDYEKNILKWIWTNQNHGGDTLLIGVGRPNSIGNLQIQLYGTSGVNSSTGYPKYSSAIYYPLGGRPICFGTTDYNFYSYSLAFSDDIKDPANYYWANIKVSASSSTATQPTFNTCYTSNWFRSQGGTGWYNQSYAGGVYMNENYWVKTYGGTMMYIAPDAHAWGIGGHNIAMKLYHSSHIGINFATSAYTWGIYANSNGNMYIGRRTGNVNDSSGTYYHTLTASYISSPGFYHSAIGSNSYVLLAGGSYKGLGDFAKGNAGSATKGVYVTGGTVTAMTYSLSSNLNSGTSGKLAYYSSATTVAAYTSSVGATNRGVYMNAGVPTVMTYYLNATVNSGASGKLAYYSGTNSIDDYTSTVGSSGTPIYLSSGVPTACTGVMVKYWASYTINNYSGTSVTYSKNGGNYNFVTSTSRRDTGRYTIGTVYPSGQTWYTTLVWAVGNLNASNSSNSSNSLLYCTLIRGYNSGSTYYWYVNTADDASTNNGSFGLFFLCF